MSVAGEQPESGSELAQPGYSDNRSCAYQTEIELPAPWAEIKNVSLAPTVGACQRMHLGEHALGPGVDLTPEKGLDVEQCLPTMTTGWARQIEPQIRLRIGFSHSPDNRVRDCSRHFADRNRLAVASRFHDTLFKQKLPSRCGVVAV